MRKPELWQALQAHQFDPAGAKMSFSDKLAEREGWTEKHSTKVVEEYRRFLYLTQVNPTQSVPSADVDKAWHLHLTYTRNYWDALCYDILGAPLHHEPATGNEPKGQLGEQYAQTRALYSEEFGKKPPRAIWRTDREALWHRLGMWIFGAGVATVFAAVILGWLNVIGSGTLFIAGGVAVAVTGAIIAGVYGVRGRKPSDGSGAGGCGSGCGD